MAFEWVIKLNDMVSDPATRIAKKLNEVERALRGLNVIRMQDQLSNLKSTQTMKRATLELQIHREKLRMLSGDLDTSKHRFDALRGSVASLVTPFRHGREALRDWLLILTPLAMGLKFVYNQASSMAHAIMGPIRAVEDATIGLRAVYGKDMGDYLIDMVKNIGPRIGRSIHELLKEATDFSTAGAPDSFIKPLLLGMADMAARGKDVKKLGYDLGAAFSRPVVDLNEMRKGLTNVMDETLVWQQMAKNLLGVDDRTAVGMADTFLVKHNMVAGEEYAKAVLQTIQKIQGGPLGTTAYARADTTTGGMIDRISARIEKLIMDLTGTRGFATLKKVMLNLIEVMGSPKLEKVVQHISDTLLAMLEPLTGPDGKRKMEDFFESMGKKIEGVIPHAKDLSHWIDNTYRFMKGLGVSWDAVTSPIATAKKYPSTSTPGQFDELDKFMGSPNQRAFDALIPHFRGRGSFDPLAPDTVVPPSGGTVKKGGKVAPAMNITIPITIHPGTAAKNMDLIPQEMKSDILGQVGDAIDQVNAEAGEGLPQ